MFPMILAMLLVGQDPQDHYANQDGGQYFKLPDIRPYTIARIPGFGFAMKDRFGEIYYMRVEDKCISWRDKRVGKDKPYVVKATPTGIVDRSVSIDNCPILDVYKAMKRSGN